MSLILTHNILPLDPPLDSPEDGQSERPQHQRPSQVQLQSLSHDVLTGEDEGGVQAAEDKRLVTVRQKQNNSPLKTNRKLLLLSVYVIMDKHYRRLSSRLRLSFFVGSKYKSFAQLLLYNYFLHVFGQYIHFLTSILIDHNSFWFQSSKFVRS